MTRREEILVKHREAIRSAASRHKASSVALVGSVARGDDTDASDYDFLTERRPDWPIREAKALRNLVSHEYFSVSHDRVWNTITTSVPEFASLIPDEFERT